MGKKGIYIALSGLDGSGKSTYQSYISKIIKENVNADIICTDGLKPLIYTKILKDNARRLQGNLFELFGDIALISYSLSLIQNYIEVIKPKLDQGFVVISHRNDLCCKAYTMLRDYKKTALPVINTMLDNIVTPDLHFFCNIEPEIAMDRINKRCEKYQYIPSINENLECLKELKLNYDYLIKTEYQNVINIDTNTNCEEIVKDLVFNTLKDKNYIIK